MTVSRRFLLTAPLALAGLAACGPTQFALGPAAVEPFYVSEAEAKAAISSIRVKHGLGPVQPSFQLRQAAMDQAELMARGDSLTHQVRWQDSFPARLKRAGFEGDAGENVSAGRVSLASALDGWMNSPPHRANLLNPDYTHFGIAAMKVGASRNSRYGIYWALVIGKPEPRRV